MLVVDLDNYFSHPDKKLLDHINGVVNGVKRRTDLKIAELSAIFHDIGKLNPNFQEKLKTGKSQGYSNHAYLSMYVFLCYCGSNYENVNQMLNNDHLLIRSIAAIIAHHHGNLPDFDRILSDEIINLEKFLQLTNSIPFSSFLKIKLISDSREFIIYNNPHKESFLNLRVIPKELENPLDFFLETQFSFASLITADKEDASYFASTADVNNFCNLFKNNLERYIDIFKNDSEINRERTNIREEACFKLKSYLEKDNRIFSLTAPTGSGKTVALLSLAGEIIKAKGNYRIIYALPFLAITEQVEEICNNIFKNQSNSISRIDSKSENKLFERYQKEMDENPEAITKIINSQFAEDLFDYPFIITTFVKVFETLLSNKNSTLLKLPNFSKTIFLIDEIQSLPPRLYGFFVALLDAFCKKFDSYAIISTATMPNFELPNNNKHQLSKFFYNYNIPLELISPEHFKLDIFNRYIIQYDKKTIDIAELTISILAENSSVLVILNTIDDSKKLFDSLLNKIPNTPLILLNTHFTPNHRKKKIRAAKWFLERNKKGISNKKVILISTQLIEAGVDIDFPIVYRDIAPIPNIIQTAGRCNRNGASNTKGKTIIFELVKDGNSRASLIYRGRDKDLLNNSRNSFRKIQNNEYELLEIQKEYFGFTQQNLIFGLHLYQSKDKKEELDLIQKIKEAAFETIGKFKLIDDYFYGTEISYYVPRNLNDNEFEKLEILYKELQNIVHKDFKNKKLKWIEIENQMRKMSNRIVQVRLRPLDVQPIPAREACFQINKLLTGYSSATGIDLSNVNQIL